jgi:hypothetical protein
MICAYDFVVRTFDSGLEDNTEDMHAHRALGCIHDYAVIILTKLVHRVSYRSLGRIVGPAPKMWYFRMNVTGPCSVRSV